MTSGPTHAILASLLALAPLAHANDFPTSARVLYVEDCMHASPGPYYEMVSKCACAADAIAAEVSFDDFTTMQTISNGMTLGGERGGVMRDSPSLQPAPKKYRALLARVKQGCFIRETQ